MPSLLWERGVLIEVTSGGVAVSKSKVTVNGVIGVGVGVGVGVGMGVGCVVGIKVGTEVGVGVVMGDDGAVV